MDPIFEQRLKTLMAFRLVMVTTLLLVAVYIESLSEYLLPFNPFYLLIGVTYGLTVIHAIALRMLRSRLALVYLQVVGDLLIITGLVYLTGGSRTGFMLLYPIAVLTGNVLLARGGGGLAALATLFYAGILWAVRSGAVSPQGLADVLFLETKALLYSVFVTGVSCATVALIGSYLSASLASASEQLEEATGQVADLQKLNEIIVGSIHSGLLTTDAAGRILYVNAYGEGILGRRAAETRGLAVASVLGSDVLRTPLPAAGGDLARLDVGYQRPDGIRLELGISASPLATTEGGFLLVFQDLTEIKRLERDVRAKDKLAAVGEMAAQLAHEIRNPLGSISGSAQVLLAEPSFSPEQGRLLEIIRRESRRLSDSLNQFLHSTRVTRVPAHPIDVGQVIAEAVLLLRNGPEVKPPHRVEFEAADGPLYCLADPDRITQVFWNLARNALEAMPEGGLLLIRMFRRQDEAVLSVRDEGRGLAGQEHSRIFEPFHSGSAVGTGLGLAIVYQIVREHHGDISVRSLATKGTEFEVHLPLAKASAAA